MFVHYSCEDLQDLEWTNISSGEKFNTGYYYRLLVAAEVLYILQGSEVSMSNFVLLFDTWFLLHSLILLMFLCLLVYLYYVI
jgi:hypothetical protein